MANTRKEHFYHRGNALKKLLNNTANKAGNFGKEENGAVIVIVACCLVVFLSVVSFATDLGLVYYQESKLQSALDSAALAAANRLPNKTVARQTALEYIEKNGFPTDNIVVEFPSDEIVRVKELDYEVKTIFANLFDINAVNLNAKAAAKYVKKKMALDFDYLMFYGDDNSTFQLGGKYNVNGSVFSNGNINVDGGSGSRIAGDACAAGSGYVNHWAVTVAGELKDRLDKETMPDYDVMIMSVAPTFSMSSFDITYNHISPTGSYVVRTNGNQNYVTGVYGSTYVSGKMTTNYNADIAIFNDLYVGGDFQEDAKLIVHGNCYVGGSLSTAWGKTMKVIGDLYVEKNFNIGGPLYVGGNLYVGGKLYRGSTYETSVDGEVYVGGDMELSGKSTYKKSVFVKGAFKKDGSTRLEVGQNVYVGKTIDWSNGGSYIGGSIYAYGQDANNGQDVVKMSGPMSLNGDIYCGNDGGKASNTVLRLSGQGAYTMQGVVYSAGKIITEQGAHGITLDGCMIAEDDITIGGSTHTYNASGATLTIYSRRGDITLTSQAGGFDLYGIIYAPKGTISLSSGGFDIWGNIIADKINCSPGGLNLGKNTRVLPYVKTVKCAVLIE